MKKTVFFLLLCSGTITTCQAQQDKDAWMFPITAQILQKSISQTSLSSNMHAQLLARSYTSGLIRYSYEQYALLLQSHQDSSAANLWCGKAAIMLWQYESFNKQTAMNAPSSPEKLQPPPLDLFAIARKCLNKSVQLAPTSAQANLEDGFFLWQWDNHMPEGLKLMQKAVILAPKDSLIHVRLGVVYMNPSVKSYDLYKAQQEFQVAIRLAPSIAFSHKKMVEIQIAKHDYQRAQSELQVYLRLAPEQEAHKEWVKQVQKTIANKL